MRTYGTPLQDALLCSTSALKVKNNLQTVKEDDARKIDSINVKDV